MNDSKLNQESTELLSGSVDEKKVENTSTVATANDTKKEDAASVQTEDTTSKVEDTTAKEAKETKVEEFKALTHLDENFVYELMAIPTLSRYEYRLVTFIMLWAKKNKIKYEFDTYGNIYLTKGEVGEGEFYPCMTAHLDSVQQKHKCYIQAGAELDVLTRTVNGKREIYIDGMGIGGDDKAGVLIGLSMFKHCDVLKAAFFLEEEIGCKGSSELNKEWFNNVGYVLGYDSPDLNRAAWSCSGTKLFSADFFKNHMQEICKEHGLTKFFSEPFTDVKQIREKTNIICMNFGSGYYNGHAENEYCVIEDMDTACRMGHALIEHLGKERFELESKTKTYTYVNGVSSYKPDEDESFLKTLGDSNRFASYGGAAYGGTNYRGGKYASGGTAYQGKWSEYDDEYDGYGDYYGGNRYGGASGGTGASKVTDIANGKYDGKSSKKEDEVHIETVRYIYERYDGHIEKLKTSVEQKCKELNIDFEAEFAKIFENTIKF